MNPVRLYSIIAVMSLALLGIMAIQVSLLKKSLDANAESFDSSVNAALREVVADLQASRMKTHIVRLQDRVEIIHHQEDLDLPIDVSTEIDAIHMFEFRDSMEVLIKSDSGINRSSSATVVWMSGQSSGMEADQNLRIELQGDPESVRMMKSTLNRLEGNEEPDLTPGDTSLILESLSQHLLNHGIDLPFGYMIGKPLDPAVQGSEEKEYSTRLFPTIHPASDFSQKLGIVFPRQNSFLFRSIWREAVGSILFSAIILLCFGLTIHTIFKQKRLSEMKNDFINNMTHELKTPLATIGLAAESLSQQRHHPDPVFIERYTGIIREENNRINHQVERVLQAAQFDRQEVLLRKTDVQVDALLTEAIRQVQLQVEQRGGSIRLELFDQPVIFADREHLLHVVSNLLDNANKYSPESPVITVSCKLRQHWVEIEVTDQGEGIPKNKQQDIFTRFYRVSEGMLHDVKGFGLGLSYVRDVVEAHGGEVSVVSKVGSGSTFTVTLPYRQSDRTDSQTQI